LLEQNGTFLVPFYVSFKEFELSEKRDVDFTFADRNR